MTSYCVICDALPGECDHNGARYLDPILYEDGGRVPDHERERWRKWGKGSSTYTPAIDTETLSLAAILELLDPWQPSEQLIERLTVAYGQYPVWLSRLTRAILDTAGVRNPCGLLWHRLGRQPIRAGT